VSRHFDLILSGGSILDGTGATSTRVYPDGSASDSSDWESVWIATAPRNPAFEGRTIAAITAANHLDSTFEKGCRDGGIRSRDLLLPKQLQPVA
jgi:hypothetical protein